MRALSETSDDIFVQQVSLDIYFLFIDLILLVWQQEGHPTCKSWVLICWWWRFDWSFARIFEQVCMYP